MKKTLIILFILLLLFGCSTTSREVTPEIESSVTNSSNKEKDQDKILIKQKLSLTVIESLDPLYSDFAFTLLELINNKDWDTIVQFIESDYYDSYVIESHGSHEDLCMFIFDTAYKGISTEYSLSDIDKAFYNGSYTLDGNQVLEGEYMYPTGEIEYFRFTIKNNDNELYLTRE